VRAFRVEEVVGEQLAPSYNVAPTQPVRAVLERTPREEPEAPPIRQIRTARWGLIPSWAKDRKIGSRLINARAETITEKPSFKAAASRRRCIVPANGYFEWEGRDGAKVPHYLHGDGVLGMAGLYELWADPEREPDDFRCRMPSTARGHVRGGPSANSGLAGCTPRVSAPQPSFSAVRSASSGSSPSKNLAFTLPSSFRPHLV